MQQDLLRQRLGLEQLLQYANHICHDGTNKCLFGYQLFAVKSVRNADKQRCMFDMEEHEDPNMSGLDEASSMEDTKEKIAADDVHIADADERRKSSPKLPHNARLPHPSDPNQVNDSTYDCTIWWWFGLTVGVFIGFTLRPRLLTLKCFICNYCFMVCGRKSKHYEERPKIKVESSK